MMVLAKSILTWNMKSIDIVILQISKQKTCHQVRRPSHPQTHRGSALEEQERQSWAEMDLSKILEFFVSVHQNSIWPNNTRRTGFSEAWWQWRLPVRWALEILVLLPGESTCCCRSSWALEIILFLAGEPPLIRSPSSTRATILGSLMITLLYLCGLTCFLSFLPRPIYPEFHNELPSTYLLSRLIILPDSFMTQGKLGCHMCKRTRNLSGIGLQTFWCMSPKKCTTAMLSYNISTLDPKLDHRWRPLSRARGRNPVCSRKVKPEANKDHIDCGED